MVLRRLIWVLLSPETRRELSFSLSSHRKAAYVGCCYIYILAVVCD